MSVVAGLRHVWRQPPFRRLLLVKLFSQTADGMIQVGVASYTLLSPERQPNAWAIAGVLAVTMLPFSVLGPFVSTVIDRWDRRRTIVTADLLRVAFSVLLAALVWLSPRGPGLAAPILLAALVAMSLERFQIATLLAGLPHTVEEGEYLAANTTLPIIGPLGLMIGAATAAAIRLTVGSLADATTADGLIFLLAAVCFVASVVTCYRFPAGGLGPSQVVVHRLADTLRDLGAAVGHLRSRRPAALGVLTLAAARLVFGFTMVATILIFRNRFHSAADLDAAIGDLAVWILATGLGLVAASAVNPFVARRFTLRVTVVAVLLAAGVNQAAPGSFFTRPTLIVASCLLGLWAQCLKMSTDTLVQAHVDDAFKGRVLVIYDVAFNAPLVLAGVVAALVRPADGLSRPAFLGCAVAYAALAALFAWRSHAIGPKSFARGTESLD
jgi:MFS family permease